MVGDENTVGEENVPPPAYRSQEGFFTARAPLTGDTALNCLTARAPKLFPALAERAGDFGSPPTSGIFRQRVRNGLNIQGLIFSQVQKRERKSA